MKKIACIAWLGLISHVASAQLVHTKWHGTLRLDNPANVILDFGKDTLVLYTVADSTVVETMLYSARDSVLSLKKIDGQSDCDGSTTGIYHFFQNKDFLFLRLASDSCLDRSSVLDTTRWRRWTDHQQVRVDESILQKYVGVYEFDPSHQLFITLEKGELQIEGPNSNLPKLPLVALSPTRFFLKIAGVEIDFVQDAKGQVTGLISHENQDYLLKKIK
jgi:Domain of unknown function (DUF3471)